MVVKISYDPVLIVQISSKCSPLNNIKDKCILSAHGPADGRHVHLS